MADDTKDLSARIARLEKLVESMATMPERPQVTDLSAEDMAAFRKVRDVLAFDPDTVCGINECFKCVTVCRVCQICHACQVCQVCQVCSVCRVCRVCDFECTCGPCNVGGMSGRFGGLGQ
jgi:hypothetical protein